MASWRFSRKRLSGDGYAATRWFWAVRDDVATSMEASAGFQTLKAREADAALSGFDPDDAVDYELVELPSRL